MKPHFPDISYKLHPKLKAHRRHQMGPKISRWQAFLWKYNSNDSLRDLVDFSISIVLLLFAVITIAFTSIYITNSKHMNPIFIITVVAALGAVAYVLYKIFKTTEPLPKPMPTVVKEESKSNFSKLHMDNKQSRSYKNAKSYNRSSGIQSSNSSSSDTDSFMTGVALGSMMSDDTHHSHSSHSHHHDYGGGGDFGGGGSSDSWGSSDSGSSYDSGSSSSDSGSSND